MPASHEYDAVVVGAGPNGLSAAIRIAQHGFSTLVLEQSTIIGGACRTEELTLPGFRHDVGSAVHPLALGSPFFSSLPLEEHGLSWLQPTIPLAHPIDKNRIAVLYQSLEKTALLFGRDADHYTRLFRPLVANWRSLLHEFLQPIIHRPQHLLQMAQFGCMALLSVEQLVRRRFSEEKTRALLAGLGAHSFLSLSSPGSASFVLVLGLLAHAVGWPIPKGGAGSITQALSQYLSSLGGRIETGRPIKSFRELPKARAVLYDLTPRQLIQIESLPSGYQRKLERFKYGPAVFKIDYALDGNIPWVHEACHSAGTVHLGGTFEEVALAESKVASRGYTDQPFLLLSQPTLLDPTRAPAGKHVLWAYAHVPFGSDRDLTEIIERQIDRFAPGFSKHVMARHVSSPAQLQTMNPNLVGGTITGGANHLWQLIARPTLSAVPYRTPKKGVYLCSSSTPPGGGVHGMCGFHAANAVLRDFHRSSK
ncbi:MAG: NAD(P)/FAD-dependent oxidoreductase [Chthoniobacterales bacterium]